MIESLNFQPRAEDTDGEQHQKAKTSPRDAARALVQAKWKIACKRTEMERQLKRKLTQGELRQLVRECLGDDAPEGSAEWTERIFRTGRKGRKKTGPQRTRSGFTVARHGGAMVAPMPESVERIVGGDILPMPCDANKQMKEGLGQEHEGCCRCCPSKSLPCDGWSFGWISGCLPTTRSHCCCSYCCCCSRASSQRVAMQEIGLPAHTHQDNDDIDEDLGP